MLITDSTDLNLTQYKRLFTIGCSFTHWMWPTWADIIAKEYPDLEYHNFGVPGCGNDYIFIMLNQLTNKYNLGDGDLVMIMWSSFHRLSAYDTYREKQSTAILNNKPATDIIKCTWNWKNGGDLIAESERLEHTTWCDRGYLIRNYALIDTVSTVMEQSAYTGAQMLSVGPFEQLIFDTTGVTGGTPSDDVHELYSQVVNKCLPGPSLYEFLDYKHNNIVWGSVANGPGEAFPSTDYHPFSSQYYAYLQVLGIKLSPSTLTWCNVMDDVIRSTNNPADLESNPNWKYNFYSEIEFPL